MVQLIIGDHKSKGSPDNLSQLVSDTVVFRFFENPKDAAPSQQLSCYFNWSSIPRKEVIIERDYRNWLSPMIFKDDSVSGYYKVYLTCVSRKGYWLEVIVNEQTQKKMWIKEEKFVRFHRWADIADKKFLTISVNTAVYARPDTNSVQATIASNCFEIDKINGDWMQVSSADAELCDSYGQARLKKVWVRFKTSERLNITVDIH